MGRGPEASYQARLASGDLAEDPAQAAAVARLQALWLALRRYDPAPLDTAPKPVGLLGRLFGRASAPARQDPPRGLYLVGEVGRGKSMLMDLFFETAEVPRKQRLHFHAFMQQAHRRIHGWKQVHGDSADPIPPLADSIAADAALLCFDEFQVHDIADAMILGRLFEALFARGTVIVATSNTAPDDLFKGQPGRDAFLPFIALINRHVEVWPLVAMRDYRRERIRNLPTWHVPADGRSEAALDAAFAELTGQAQGAPMELPLLGRVIEVPEAARGVARFDFNQLCGKPLGPADYLAIAQAFHSLVVDDIPRLGPENFDKARRFITCIDTLYEHRCKLVASAASSPDQLYER
ncbi:MAG: AFG1 family ATPase, partial [Acetobacteraceae bacterium]|nr:AFG1 family ATPase [Acetobacteraceae bacterium]